MAYARILLCVWNGSQERPAKTNDVWQITVRATTNGYCQIFMYTKRQEKVIVHLVVGDFGSLNALFKLIEKYVLIMNNYLDFGFGFLLVKTVREYIVSQIEKSQQKNIVLFT